MKYTVNQMRGHIFKSGYYYDMTHRDKVIFGFLMGPEKAWFIGNCKNITDFLNALLDKICELEVSGKYITKEMFEK